MKVHSKFFLLLTLFCLIPVGCGGEYDTNVSVWGSQGHLPGRFGLPRGIGARDGFVYVIDRTGRVQKFDSQGEYLMHWMLEKFDIGTPTGIAFDSKGMVWIADTHNSRIQVFTPDGELTLTFGEYGEADGQFIYPTDVAFDHAGNVYVVEYGRNDRVQVFTPEGDFLFSWGEFGEHEGQFNRPMAIEFGPDDHFYIADTGNHRIQVFTQEGEWVRAFGRRGSEPGEFDFPFDMEIDEEGYLYVTDYSNHRIQQLTAQGEYVRSWGGLGVLPGQLTNPWGVALDGDYLYVADTGNHRVQAFPIDRLTSRMMP